MSELELLRDVARATAEFLKAEDEWYTHRRSLMVEPQAPEDRDATRLLCDTAISRRTDLDRALARLAEAAPGQFAK
jgi:hypothetical protein